MRATLASQSGGGDGACGPGERLLRLVRSGSGRQRSRDTASQRRLGFHDNRSASSTSHRYGRRAAGGRGRERWVGPELGPRTRGGPFEADGDHAARPKESVSTLARGRPVSVSPDRRWIDRVRHSLPRCAPFRRGLDVDVTNARTPDGMVGVIRYRRRSSRMRPADRALRRRRSCSAPGRVHLALPAGREVTRRRRR